MSKSNDVDGLVERLRAVDHLSVEDCFLQSPLFAKAADALSAIEAAPVEHLDTVRLREAVKVMNLINRRGGCGLDVHGWIDTFLSSIKEPET